MPILGSSQIITELEKEYIYYKKESELSSEDLNLIEQAKKASKNSYAPYSNFYVGAALLLDNGEILHGANQENAAYPSGLCAERVAIFNCMNSYPERKIKKIAVIAHKNKDLHILSAAPCGGCRQVMLEQEQKQGNEIEVVFKIDDSWIKAKTIKALLPFSFDKNTLIS